MMKRKKAAIFSVGLILILFITLTYLFFSTTAKDTILMIDGTAYNLFSTYQDSVRFNMYLDQAAKIAMDQAVYQMALFGGKNNLDTNCNYFGFNKWDDNLCKPEFTDNFPKAFDMPFKKLLAAYPDNRYRFYDFNYAVLSTNPLELLGKSNKDVEIKYKVTQLIDLSTPLFNITKKERDALSRIQATYSSEIAKVTNDQNLKNLMLAMILAESGGNQYAVSPFGYPYGCVGLFQLCKEHVPTNAYLQACCNTYPCDESSFSGNCLKDERFDITKSIKFASDVMKQYLQYSDIKTKDAKYELALAIYKTKKYQSISKAINEVNNLYGNKNPPWILVWTELDLPEEEKENLLYYVSLVMSYKSALEKGINNIPAIAFSPRKIFIPKDIFQFSTGFREKPFFNNSYSADIYTSLQNYATSLTNLCSNDNLKSPVECASEYITNHASSLRGFLVSIDKCYNPDENNLYRYAEYIDQCHKSIDDDCICLFDSSKLGHAEGLPVYDFYTLHYLFDATETTISDKFGHSITLPYTIDKITLIGTDLKTVDLDKEHDIAFYHHDLKFYNLTYPRYDVYKHALYKNNSQLFFTALPITEFDSFVNSKPSCSINKEDLRLCFKDGKNNIFIADQNLDRVENRSLTYRAAVHIVNLLPPAPSLNVFNAMYEKNKFILSWNLSTAKDLKYYIIKVYSTDPSSSHSPAPDYVIRLERGSSLINWTIRKPNDAPFEIKVKVFTNDLKTDSGYLVCDQSEFEPCAEFGVCDITTRQSKKCKYLDEKVEIKEDEIYLFNNKMTIKLNETYDAISNSHVNFTENKQYFFIIEARDSGGVSSSSAVVSATAKNMVPINVLDFEISSGKIIWEAPTEDFYGNTIILSDIFYDLYCPSSLYATSLDTPKLSSPLPSSAQREQPLPPSCPNIAVAAHYSNNKLIPVTKTKTP